MSDKKDHWEKVYNEKVENQLSWTQTDPSQSIDWIKEVCTDRSNSIIDIGGGTSHLIDALLNAGYEKPAILDISHAALKATKNRLGVRAQLVDFFEGDIETVNISRSFDLWHDRAVFHFLTTELSRKNYTLQLGKVLKPGGVLIIATFSLTGPAKCSGLDVTRWDDKALQQELGSNFELQKSQNIDHLTPWGSIQNFIYCKFKKLK